MLVEKTVIVELGESQPSSLNPQQTGKNNFKACALKHLSSHKNDTLFFDTFKGSKIH